MLSAMRRTTIVTDDMDLCKKFYVDGLGLEVFYDNVLENETSGKLMQIDSPKVHLVSLKTADEPNGMVGLMKFLEPKGYATREEVKEKVGRTDIVMVFRSDDVNGLYKRLIQLGFTPNTAPLEYEIPQRGMARALSCFDPNGVLCEFTQYL